MVLPDSSRYSTMLLAQGFDEPVGMDIMPNNNVLIVERKGGIRLYVAKEKKLKTLAHLGVFSGIEDGLLGVALDAGFAENNWVYLYYAVAGSKAVNRLSRFTFKGEVLDLRSEKVLLEIPTQRKYCCHSAGGLLSGPDGLLYLATGDNTNAEEAEGYIPIDERPGRELADAQATTANSKDLRGKILRIKPQPDGTYTIPDGNLFPKDGSQGRPEVYIMGSRNPYRMSLDPKNNFLYWGDVGPATQVPGSEGTMSYDEINQARGAGFFGWPYFLGENEAFPYYSFATRQEGPKFDPQNPVNLSPNNTGLKKLPPAQPAFIWYGRLPSQRFPLVGKGGASAMAGPVYYSDLYPHSKYKLSPYYHGKLIIYDWVRRWMMAVTLDKEGNYLSMERFLPHIKLTAPVDIKIAPDGALYILEYGTNWFSKNTDSRLSRVEYSEGNRNPIAHLEADHFYGAAPMAVKLSGKQSKDYDANDKLSFEWMIGREKFSGKELSYTFTQNGIYDVILNVYDANGGAGSSAVQIKVGNTAPKVNILTSSNKSFFWQNKALDYQVTVADQEDKQIDPSRVNVYFNYFQHGNDMASGFMDDNSSTKHLQGAKLVANLDCKACHSLNQKSIGPSYKSIATRYAGNQAAPALLKEKIIKGGSGNWGKFAMTPHPDLSDQDAGEIVQYILSVNEKSKRLPLKGKLPLDQHAGNTGSYLLTASYQDQGANHIEPLSTRAHISLRSPQMQIEDSDSGNLRIGTITTAFLSYARTKDKGYMRFNQIDLTHISSLTYRIQQHGEGGDLEVRTDRLDGPLLSKTSIAGGEVKDLKTNWKELTVKITPVSGVKDVYLVFRNPAAGAKNLFNIDWFYFNHK
ncbi:MAG: PQQ-dependent sugar dehydrogenase [Adhaeribacter sp.]